MRCRMRRLESNNQSKAHITQIKHSHTDVNITKSSQTLPKLNHLLLISLNLLPLLILRATLLLSVETQVLKQHHLPTRGIVNSLLNLRTNAVVREDDAPAQQLLQLGNHGLQTVLRVRLAVRPAQVRHQHYGFGAVLNRIFDGWQGADDALGVGDVLFCVEGDIEVDLLQTEVTVSINVV